jgi:subtilisin family serine protease
MKISILLTAILTLFNQVVHSQDSYDIQASVVGNIIETGTVGTVKKTFGNLIIQFPSEVDFSLKDSVTIEREDKDGNKIKQEVIFYDECFEPNPPQFVIKDEKQREFPAQIEITVQNVQRQLLISFSDGILKQGTYSIFTDPKIKTKNKIAKDCSATGEELTFELKPNKFHVLDLRENSDYTIILLVDRTEYPENHPVLKLLEQLKSGNAEKTPAPPPQDGAGLDIFDIKTLGEPNHPVKSCRGELVKFTPSLLRDSVYQPGILVNDFISIFAKEENFGIDPRSKGGIGSTPQGDEGEPVADYRTQLGLVDTASLRGEGVIIAVLDTGIDEKIFNGYDLNGNRLLNGISFVNYYPYEPCDTEGNCSEVLTYRAVRDQNDPEENQLLEGIGTAHRQSDNYDKYGFCDVNETCYTYDLFDNPPYAPLLYEFGHGTAIALLAAGGTAINPIGIAPGAQILPVQVCDAIGECSLFDVVRGLCYTLEKAATLNEETTYIKEEQSGVQNNDLDLFNNLVINLSLSFSSAEFQAPLLTNILKEATDKGAVIVASAGDVYDVAHEDCLKKKNNDIVKKVKNEQDFKEVMEDYVNCEYYPQLYSNRNFYLAAIRVDSENVNESTVNSEKINLANSLLAEEFDRDELLFKESPLLEPIGEESQQSVPIDGLITVGGLTFKDSYFSKGKFTPSKNVDVYAPGCIAIDDLYLSLNCGKYARITQDEISSYKNCYGDKFRGSYFICDNPNPNPLNGSSFAAGIISGVVALLREKCPSASPEDIEAMLTFNSEDYVRKQSSGTQTEEFFTLINKDYYLGGYMSIPDLKDLHNIACPTESR